MGFIVVNKKYTLQKLENDQNTRKNRGVLKNKDVTGPGIFFPENQ